MIVTSNLVLLILIDNNALVTSERPKKFSKTKSIELNNEGILII